MLDDSPDELDRHRVALQTARKKRRDQIATRTEKLLARMDAAASAANTQVLLHPLQSGAVIRSSNQVAADIVVFNGRLGVQGEREALEAKRWSAAAGDVRDKVLETGADGVDAAKRLGGKALDGTKATTDNVIESGADSVDAAKRLGNKALIGTKSTTEKLTSGFALRLSRLRRRDTEKNGDSAESS